MNEIEIAKLHYITSFGTLPTVFPPPSPLHTRNYWLNISALALSQSRIYFRLITVEWNAVFFLQGYCPLAKGAILGEESIKAVAMKHNKTPAQVCIRWSIQNGVPAIPKSRQMHRILENSEVAFSLIPSAYFRVFVPIFRIEHYHVTLDCLTKYWNGVYKQRKEH